MKKAKGLLQRISTVSGILSFIASILCGAYLYIRFSKLGAFNPVTASLEASIFFFICVGVVLIVMGRTDLPSFKIEE